MYSSNAWTFLFVFIAFTYLKRVYSLEQDKNNNYLEASKEFRQLKKSLLKELVESIEILKFDLKSLKELNQLEKKISNEQSMEENNLNDFDKAVIPSSSLSLFETSSLRKPSNEYIDQDIEKRENAEAKTRSPYLRFGRNKVFLRFGKRSEANNDESVSNKKKSIFLRFGK